MQLADKLKQIDTTTVGGRIKYYRMLNKISVPELSALTGVSRDNILQYEECANFCPPSFCAAAAKVFQIDLSVLCDDYIRFLSSDYIAKINREKAQTGLSYYQIAANYNIPPAALVNWVKAKYVPCRTSFQKYIKDNPLFYSSLSSLPP